MKKHCFLIIAHSQFNIAKRLIYLLLYDADGNRLPHHVLVHIDKKAFDAGYKELRNIVGCDIIPKNEAISVAHGGFSQIKVELLLLKKAIALNYDYYHLLSGVDFPIKPMKEFDSFFDNAGNRSFLKFDSQHNHITWSKKKYPSRLCHYYFNDLPGRRIKPINYLILGLNKLSGYLPLRKYPAETRAGWNWFSLHCSVVEFILGKLALNPKLFDRYRMTSCADEIFLHTLLYPYLKELAIESNSALRYVDWTTKIPERNRVDSPLTLTIQEYEYIRNSDCFFCRKVDNKYSLSLLDKLEKDVLSS